MTIIRAEAFLVDLEPEVVRTDAIQAFVKQETIFVEIPCDDGTTGLGYSYTLGTGGRAVVNAARWLTGADAYPGPLPAYRQYLVNHEVGHLFGRGHESCPGAGQPAPVMMQQTKGVGACTPPPPACWATPPPSASSY